MELLITLLHSCEVDWKSTHVSKPAWGVRELAMMQGASALLKPETLHAALIGIPCALVWRLARH
jgi:hypothetical protein